MVVWCRGKYLSEKASAKPAGDLGRAPPCEYLFRFPGQELEHQFAELPAVPGLGQYLDRALHGGRRVRDPQGGPGQPGRRYLRHSTASHARLTDSE